MKIKTPRYFHFYYLAEGQEVIRLLSRTRPHKDDSSGWVFYRYDHVDKRWSLNDPYGIAWADLSKYKFIGKIGP